MRLLFCGLPFPLELLRDSAQVFVRVNIDGRKPMSTKQDGVISRATASLVEQMIEISGAKHTDNVAIAGSGHLDFLVTLCRRGFDRVTCWVTDRAAPITEAPADVLFVLNVGGDAEALTALGRVGRTLRPSGVLVIRYAAQFPKGHGHPLHRLLAGYGFAMTRQTVDAAGCALLCARKQASAVQARAA
jgi:hypothetical protein